MTNSSNNTQSQTVAYFNAHTEALGYLDSLVQVVPKPGQDFDAFWSASFCILEGNPQKPEKTYVSLTVPGEKAIEELLPYMDDINGAAKVFVGLRLAMLRAKPFAFGADSQSPGKLGVNYSARLISVLYLKVGDTVVKLKRDGQEATTDYGVSVSSVAQRSVRSQSPEVGAEKPAVSSGQSDMPYIVQLSKDGISAEEFEVAKTRLKDAGYKWQAEMKVWALPFVKLDKNEPEFQTKMAELKKLGYRWNNGVVAWEMSFSKPQQSRHQGGSSSDNQQQYQQRSYQQH